MSGNPAINATMVDQTVDDVQIDSSSPQKPDQRAPYADKWEQPFQWGKGENEMTFDYLDPYNIKDQKKETNAKLDGMSMAQLEVYSTKMSQIIYTETNKYHYYWCFTLLILISVVNTFQRSTISFMYTFATSEEKMYDPHYSIRDSILDFTDENYILMVGDSFTIIYAFMVLFTGSASDLFDRKMLLCGSCFCWCSCMYLSSFATNFHQLYVLRLVMSFFTAFSGPCSYSLITDWIPPQNRTMAYSLYALGVQFGGPLAPFNVYLIDWLGWRACFQATALLGFIVLAFALISFDEPERGRFDIAQSVIVNPNLSMKSGSQANGAFDLSEDTRKELNVRRQQEDATPKLKHVQDYFKAVRELFVNECALWILLAACLRTQQGIAMGLFTNEYFKVYPGRDNEFNTLSTISGLIGTFICTLGTAVISDTYDNINYMTKAYICIITTMISIPCCIMIYLNQWSFWISMSGLFIEYLLSTGWGQPAIGILSSVCDANIRGTAISVFFFLISIFGVLAPYGYTAIQNHYGLDPIEEPAEFGVLIACCTIIPCILAIPCFYIAGVKYSWHKYNEAMFMLDVWGEMEQYYEDEITLKRKSQMIGDPAEKMNFSVSVDYKIRTNKRKIKMREFKDRVDQEEKLKKENKRASLLDDHDNQAGLYKKQKTMVGVLPEDVSKKDYVTQSITNSDSGEVGPDGKKISYSHDGDDYDRSLLFDYDQRNNQNYQL